MIQKGTRSIPFSRPVVYFVKITTSPYHPKVCSVFWMPSGIVHHCHWRQVAMTHNDLAQIVDAMIWSVSEGRLEAVLGSELPMCPARHHSVSLYGFAAPSE